MVPTTVGVVAAGGASSRARYVRPPAAAATATAARMPPTTSAWCAGLRRRGCPAGSSGGDDDEGVGGGGGVRGGHLELLEVSGWSPGRVTWRRPSSARLARRWHGSVRSPGFASSPLQARNLGIPPLTGRGVPPYRRGHGDLGSRNTRGQPRRSRRGRPGLVAAAAAGAARAHAGPRGRAADRLVDALWGEAPPSAASATLQSHVARLRRDLSTPDWSGPGGTATSSTSSRRPSTPSSSNERSAQGSKALLDGRVEEASAAARGGADLWRGAPYAEFADCPSLEAEAERLGALRLDALERRISADLARPGIAPPIAELEALVRWHPMRESFWALLMAAQYRAGRQGDALATYQRARATLADELGVDPGPQLQELERLILAQDPSLELSGMSTFLPARRERGAYADSWHWSRGPHFSRPSTGCSTTPRRARVGSPSSTARPGSGSPPSCASGAALRVRGRASCGAPATRSRRRGRSARSSTWLRSSTRGSASCSGRASGTACSRRALAALAEPGPTVLVVEDLHWADMSTLDLMRFLSRRLEGTQILVVATYRDEHLQPVRPAARDARRHRLAAGRTATRGAVAVRGRRGRARR